MRQRGEANGRRGRLSLRQHRLPRTAAGEPAAFLVAKGHEHRWARRGPGHATARAASYSRQAGHEYRGLVLTRRGWAAFAGADWEEVRRLAAGGDCRVKESRV